MVSFIETNAFLKEYEFILLMKLRSHYLGRLLVSVQYFTMKKLIKSQMGSDSWNIKKYIFSQNDILLLEYSMNNTILKFPLFQTGIFRNNDGLWNFLNFKNWL